MPTKRELELEMHKTISSLVELMLLMDSKIDILMEKVNEGKGSEESKKSNGVRAKK